MDSIPIVKTKINEKERKDKSIIFLEIIPALIYGIFLGFIAPFLSIPFMGSVAGASPLRRLFMWMSMPSILLFFIVYIGKRKGRRRFTFLFPIFFVIGVFSSSMILLNLGV